MNNLYFLFIIKYYKDKQNVSFGIYSNIIKLSIDEQYHTLL